MSVQDRRRDWFSMGRVISRTFSTIRSHLSSMLLISLLFTIVPNVLSGMLQIQLDPQDAPLARLIDFPVNLIGLFGGVAMTHLAMMHLQGRRASFGDSLAKAGGLFLAAWGLSILSGLGIGLGLLLLIVPGLFLIVAWSVALPARIMDGPGVGAALSESMELTKGVRWKIFALMMMLIILFVVVAIANGVVSELASGAVPQIFELAGLPLLVAVIQLLASVGRAALYHELRWGPEAGPPEAMASVFD